jgi:hypothetical protein
LGAVIFIVILVPCALLVRSISRNDISTLHGMVSGLGAIGRLFGRILDILEKIMGFLRL